MTNKELTQAIIALVLEEVNGYSHEEAELFSKGDNGELESKISTILEEEEKKHIDSGVWLAITEFAFHNESHQLIEDVIIAMGYSYDDCMNLMQQSGCNNDVLEPIINKTFGMDSDDDEAEEAEEAPTECPMCGRTLDDADYDFQICHHCGWNGNNKE